jgi:hypothetical protein
LVTLQNRAATRSFSSCPACVFGCAFVAKKSGNSFYDWLILPQKLSEGPPNIKHVDEIDQRFDAWLARSPVLDPATASMDANLVMAERYERLIAYAQARQVRHLAQIASHPDPVPGPAHPSARERIDLDRTARLSATQEVACLLRWSTGYTIDRMGEAARLVTQLPDTLQAVERGKFGYLFATSLLRATKDLDPTVTGKIEARVLERAGDQTVSEFRAALRRAVAKLDPRGEQEQHEDEVAQRRVCHQPAEHAMAWVNTYLSAPDAQTVLTAVQAQADKLKAAAGPDDCRCADQYRADALVAICVAALHGQSIEGLPKWQGRHPQVQVMVALSTLLGMDEQPGELAGYGPIPAGLARKMAADPTSTWTRLVTDDLGQLVDYGREKYRPPQDLIDHVTARDRTCRGPHCHRHARRCEVDHVIPFSEGGPTNATNLGPECPREHHVKHDAGWQVERLPDGSFRWTTPSGRTYDRPAEQYPIDQTRPKLEPPEPDEGRPPPFEPGVATRPRAVIAPARAAVATATGRGIRRHAVHPNAGTRQVRNRRVCRVLGRSADPAAPHHRGAPSAAPARTQYVRRRHAARRPGRDRQPTPQR